MVQCFVNTSSLSNCSNVKYTMNDISRESHDPIALKAQGNVFTGQHPIVEN